MYWAALNTKNPPSCHSFGVVHHSSSCQRLPENIPIDLQSGKAIPGQWRTSPLMIQAKCCTRVARTLLHYGVQCKGNGKGLLTFWNVKCLKMLQAFPARTSLSLLGVCQTESQKPIHSLIMASLFAFCDMQRAKPQDSDTKHMNCKSHRQALGVCANTRGTGESLDSSSLNSAWASHQHGRDSVAGFCMFLYCSGRFDTSSLAGVLYGHALS